MVIIGPTLWGVEQLLQALYYELQRSRFSVLAVTNILEGVLDHMNLSTKIKALILAVAMSFGFASNANAQGGPLAALGLGTVTGVTVATAVAIGAIGIIAVQAAGNDNFDAPLPRGSGIQPSGGTQSTFDTQAGGPETL